jgi:hypothetical protein
MKLLVCLAALLTGVTLSTNAVQAADKTYIVKFKPGASYATRKGSIKGYDLATYVLDAYSGQSISVLFSANRASCTFNYFSPGAASAEHVGDIDGNEYAATLRRSGKNRVSIGMNRNAARKGLTCTYSVTFEIR